jgi:protein-tyrosine phosphatase
MFKIVENKLATEGIHEFTIYELNDVDHETEGIANIVWPVSDVRDLDDDDSNSLEDYEKKIDLAWELIEKQGRVVICCVAGISRSNAIALGVLVKYFDMDFYDAWELVRQRVPRANINPSHISKLKKLFGVTLP